MGLRIKETHHTSNKAHKKENSYGLVNSEDNYSHHEKQIHLHYYQRKHTQYFLIISISINTVRLRKQGALPIIKYKARSQEETNPTAFVSTIFCYTNCFQIR